ncbi:MAG: thioesterase [Burkholderiales bacterium PBB5]|nr:MAG: thioesterase [Burkholderiales bacterium PBB5]
MPVFTTNRTVLFGDCDPAGVIYTPRVGHFIVEAVLEFQAWLLGGPAARSILAMGIQPPAKALSVVFIAPLTWDEQIELAVSCAAIGETSFTCEVLARRLDGGPVFSGTLTQVCVSPHSRRPVAIPTALCQALQGAGLPDPSDSMTWRSHDHAPR